MNNFEKLSLEQLHKQLQCSPAVKLLIENYAFKDVNQAMEISSIYVGLLKVAWMDRLMTEAEMKYILRETKKFCKYNDSSRKKLIDIFSTLVRRNIHMTQFLPYHYVYLKHIYQEDQRLHYFKSLAIIARSDLDFSQTEEAFARKVATYLGISHRDINETILNSKYLALIRSEEHAQGTKEEVPYQVPDEIDLDLD